jgi:translation initiation factor 2 beta subunit (eIF-2beta)/eIF-5
MNLKKKVNKQLVLIVVCGECESDDLACYRDHNDSILSMCNDCGAMESTKEINEEL